MRAAMAAALDERKMRVFIVIDTLGGEAPDRFGQQVRIVRHFGLLHLLPAQVHDRFLTLDELPFEGQILAINIEALEVLARGIEQKAGRLKSNVLVPDLEV